MRRFHIGMNRLTRTLVAVLVAALAMQPAIAGLNCASRRSAQACMTHCPMAAAQMGADCPMHHQHHLAANASCTGECCGQSKSSTNYQLNLSAESKVAPAAPTAHLPAAPAAPLAVALVPPALGSTSPPPRYLLLRVFRI